MPRHIVVDVDGHITEPFDMWERYLDPKFHDVAPRLVRTDDGVDAVAFGGGIHVPADNGIGMSAPARCTSGGTSMDIPEASSRVRA